MTDWIVEICRWILYVSRRTKKNFFSFFLSSSSRFWIMENVVALLQRSHFYLFYLLIFLFCFYYVKLLRKIPEPFNLFNFLICSNLFFAYPRMLVLLQVAVLRLIAHFARIYFEWLKLVNGAAVKVCILLIYNFSVCIWRLGKDYYSLSKAPKRFWEVI